MTTGGPKINDVNTFLERFRKYTLNKKNGGSAKKEMGFADRIQETVIDEVEKEAVKTTRTHSEHVESLESELKDLVTTGNSDKILSTH